MINEPGTGISGVAILHCLPEQAELVLATGRERPEILVEEVMATLRYKGII
jgi:adenylylsulfate kinase-like enzyme